MINFVRSIPDWGLHPDTPLYKAQHIRLTNVLLLLMFFGSIIWTGVLFASGARDAAIVNSSAPFVFLAGLFLMKAGYTTTARVFVLGMAYSSGFVLMTGLGPGTYFQFIFLFASAFSVIFFTREEKFLLAFGVFAGLACFIALEITSYEPVLGMRRADLSTGTLTFMRVMSTTLIWGLLIGHFFYFVKRRRQSQEQLVSSSKMVAMGRMAAGIAHEVNNPLQRIVGHADRLKAMAAAGAVSPEQIVTLSSQIQQVAMQIASVVKGLLALSRDGSNDQLLEVSVGSVVDMSLDYCRARLESHQVELRARPISKNLLIMGREAQLSEVLLNVLSNAFDAVQDGSSPRWIEIETATEPTGVVIAISDSGPGIDPELRNRIFDPFFTTKPVGRGTGLGLSVSQGIMAAHGGTITLDERSPHTRFVIKFPPVQSPSHASPS